MLRQGRYGSTEAEDDLLARVRQQDDDFCRVLIAAIEAGRESCPVGVITEPGTKKPILGYQGPDSYY